MDVLRRIASFPLSCTVERGCKLLQKRAISPAHQISSTTDSPANLILEILTRVGPRCFDALPTKQRDRYLPICTTIEFPIERLQDEVQSLTPVVRGDERRFVYPSVMHVVQRGDRPKTVSKMGSFHKYCCHQLGVMEI